MNISRFFPYTLGIKFDFVIKYVKVNPESSFLGRAHIPNATYQVLRPLPYGFQKKLEMCPWDTDAPAIAKFA